MAVSAVITKHSALNDILDGTIDLDTDAMYGALYKGAHTPAEADATRADLANEADDVDYAQVALSGQAIITVGAANKGRAFDSNDVDFGQDVDITAKYMYLMVGSAAAPASTDLILGCMDLKATLAAITGITKANPAVVTSAGHGLTNGDTVVIYGCDMPEVNRRHFTVANVTANTFELQGVDSTGYLVPGTVGTWFKVNDTNSQTSNPIFQVNAPATGWFSIG